MDWFSDIQSGICRYRLALHDLPTFAVNSTDNSFMVTIISFVTLERAKDKLIVFSFDFSGITKRCYVLWKNLVLCT